jgi:hypothetical protein
MSKISYTDFVTLVDILESTTDANVEKPHFYFRHETLRKCHATVTKRGTVYDYTQRADYPDVMSWVNDSITLLPATAGNPLQNLRFGDATAFLDLEEIVEALGWTLELPAAAAPAPAPAPAPVAAQVAPIRGGAGAGAGAAAAAAAPRFIPTRSKRVATILHKIERGEALTEEEGKTELFDDDEGDGLKIKEEEDTDSSYAPSEATEEDGMADLTGRMNACHVAVTEARKEADRLFKHMMSLATTHSASPQVVSAVQKAYEQQKQKETAAAVQYVGAYLDDRGLFGYAPNVARILDKELGDYAPIAKAMLH